MSTDTLFVWLCLRVFGVGLWLLSVSQTCKRGPVPTCCSNAAYTAASFQDGSAFAQMQLRAKRAADQKAKEKRAEDEARQRVRAMRVPWGWWKVNSIFFFATSCGPQYLCVCNWQEAASKITAAEIKKQQEGFSLQYPCPKIESWALAHRTPLLFLCALWNLTLDTRSSPSYPHPNQARL